MDSQLKDLTIGEIVARDFRTAAIFKEAGIDFCCGKKTIDETCAEKKIDIKGLLTKLENAGQDEDTTVHRFNEWEPGFLTDYIINVHHSYVKKSLPETKFYVDKIASVHGANHPELRDVAELFSQVENDLTAHLLKEEEVFFPAIKQLFSTGSGRAAAIVKEELGSLSEEHESAGGAMDRINILTKGYELPEDACNSYRLAFKMLSAFEDDLHVHVHLENNVLFPKTTDKLKNV
ncbi:MAG TPA: iron-sulfur cluster repair di-iron protein [Bacteroidales bacterium]|nr:iron-sulfur cluster repair di-iron protein [Bacteroidales bacterium]